MIFQRILIALAFCAASGGSAAWAATTIETPASHAILIDYETGDVLFSKSGDERMGPASMSKLMTSVLVFEKLRTGDLRMEDTFRVSESAWGRGADSESNMFVALGSEVRVGDLLRGIIIQSGNDACKVIAEGIAGSEPAFADLMNEEAERIGLTGSHFVNASGLPDPEHYMTPHDLARLARYIIKTFPEYYELYSEREFEWNGIKQQNRNPLLYSFSGADGLKTGHTLASGFGLTASAVRDGRRLILVVNGLGSEKERASESARLLDIGFREFKGYDLFASGAVVGEAEVWNGAASAVKLRVGGAVSLLMRREARKALKVTYAYDGPIAAPIAEGQELGSMTISVPDRDPVTVPLYAAESVDRADIVSRLVSAAKSLL